MPNLQLGCLVQAMIGGRIQLFPGMISKDYLLVGACAGRAIPKGTRMGGGIYKGEGVENLNKIRMNILSWTSLSCRILASQRTYINLRS